VKFHISGLASALPARSVTPVEIVAVKVPVARLLKGVKVAIVPVTSREIVPVTGKPASVTVKVAVLIVAGSIAVLKVALIALGHTPVALLAGLVESTVGAMMTGAVVVKLQT
jgi:hypothetical protein